MSNRVASVLIVTRLHDARLRTIYCNDLVRSGKPSIMTFTIESDSTPAGIDADEVPQTIGQTKVYTRWLEAPASRAIEHSLQALHIKVDHVMKTEQDLQNDLDTVSSTLDAVTVAVAGVAALVVDQNTAIKNLRDQVAKGVPVTQDQLDGLTAEGDGIVAKAQAIKDALAAVGAAPTPTPAPVPDPVPVPTPVPVPDPVPTPDPVPVVVPDPVPVDPATGSVTGSGN